MPQEFESLVNQASPQKVYQHLLQEMKDKKEYFASLRGADDGSSCGSDSEPSEDNLDPTDLAPKLPEIDSALNQALKKYQKAKDAPAPIKIRFD